MLVLDEFSRIIKTNLYGKKANKLGISNYMVTSSNADYGINVIKLITTSSNKEELREKVIKELCDDRNTDYLHISLIMGLYFGCFNLYNYMYIDSSVRKKIVSSNINRDDTFNFIKNNLDKICEYFEDKYNIDRDIVIKIINMMFFTINSEDETIDLYNNVITRDISIILMSNTLFGNFEDFEESINTFIDYNSISKIKVDKK